MKENIDPKMHTAEHLLNRAMIMTVGTDRCFGAHIEKRKSKCDYLFNRALKEQEKVLIEKLINEQICAAQPVHESFLPRPKAAEIYNLSRLPDENAENIRIISIGEFDACPCSGPHVGNTRELGVFKIISHSFDQGVLRVRYKLTTNPDVSGT
jgi:misacylated tRNA(Ala) deacylase